MPDHARGWGSERAAREAMHRNEDSRTYDVAAIAALDYADYLAVRSPEGAAIITSRALVYATLHVAEFRGDRLPAAQRFAEFRGIWLNDAGSPE